MQKVRGSIPLSSIMELDPRRNFDHTGLTAAERARDLMRRFPVKDGLVHGDATELEWFIVRAIQAAEADARR